MVTDLLKIPTIGIGAGASVSGQVLVYHDVLGLNPGFKPKFLRTYADTFAVIQAALNAYGRDVKDGSFPSDGECYEAEPASLRIAKPPDLSELLRHKSRLCTCSRRIGRVSGRRLDINRISLALAAASGPAKRLSRDKARRRAYTGSEVWAPVSVYALVNLARLSSRPL